MPDLNFVPDPYYCYIEVECEAEYFRVRYNVYSTKKIREHVKDALERLDPIWQLGAGRNGHDGTLRVIVNGGTRAIVHIIFRPGKKPKTKYQPLKVGVFPPMQNIV